MLWVALLGGGRGGCGVVGVGVVGVVGGCGGWMEGWVAGFGGLGREVEEGGEGCGMWGNEYLGFGGGGGDLMSGMVDFWERVLILRELLKLEVQYDRDPIGVFPNQLDPNTTLTQPPSIYLGFDSIQQTVSPFLSPRLITSS